MAAQRYCRRAGGCIDVFSRKGYAGCSSELTVARQRTAVGGALGMFKATMTSLVIELPKTRLGDGKEIHVRIPRDYQE